MTIYKSIWCRECNTFIGYFLDKDAFSSGFTYGFKKGNQSHIRKLQED